MRTAQEIIRDVRVTQAGNGICYASTGEVALPSSELERMVTAVPRSIAAALNRKAFYFVPLTLGDGEKTLVAEKYDRELTDQAICHRNIDSADAQCVFISTRLLEDRFSIAFEFYINVAHAFVDVAGVSQEFADLAWQQVTAGVRGETSVDAFEFRRLALGEGPGGTGHTDEKARADYAAASFTDAIAVYMLSLCIDINYHELREREYPLLAPPALAERLNRIAALFPPNPGFQFNIFYRRRT